MTDIVERLREHNNWMTSPDKILNEAADTITTLRAEVAALREGLAFYADKVNYARFYNPEGFGLSGREPVLADFGKNARALLETNHAVK